MQLGQVDEAAGASPPQAETSQPLLTGPKRWLLLGFGYLLFGLGLVGLFLPLMPTVIFWILAAACFYRTCPAMRARVLSWPGVGRTIEVYLTRGALSAGAKRAAVLGLAGVGGLSLFLLRAHETVVLVVAAVLLAVAVYILTRPTDATPASE